MIFLIYELYCTYGEFAKLTDYGFNSIINDLELAPETNLSKAYLFMKACVVQNQREVGEDRGHWSDPGEEGKNATVASGADRWISSLSWRAIVRRR